MGNVCTWIQTQSRASPLGTTQHGMCSDALLIETTADSAVLTAPSIFEQTLHKSGAIIVSRFPLVLYLPGLNYGLGLRLEVRETESRRSTLLLDWSQPWRQSIHVYSLVHSTLTWGETIANPLENDLQRISRSMRAKANEIKTPAVASSEWFLPNLREPMEVSNWLTA